MKQFEMYIENVGKDIKREKFTRGLKNMVSRIDEKNALQDQKITTIYKIVTGNQNQKLKQNNNAWNFYVEELQ